MRSITLILPVLFLLVLALGVSAQPMAGDYIVPISSAAGGAVLVITPAGVVTTLFPLPQAATALTMATNNTDLAVMSMSGGSVILDTVTPKGQVTQLAKWSSYIGENLAVDSNGTYAAPLGAGGVQVLRIDSFGAMTTLVPSPAIGKGKPRGIAIDINSGGYFVGEIPNLFRILPSGASTVVHTNVAINNGIDMVSDARSGDVVISQQASLVRVDPFSGVMTTIQGGFTGCLPGLAYDRTNDAWVMVGSCANTNFNLYRVTRAGALTTVVGVVGATDIEVYGSLNVVGSGDPKPGTPFSLRFSEPGSAGDVYVAAASLSAGPGIPTAAGVVDLAPDNLFRASREVPTVFVNFTGVLDGAGSAVGKILLPAVPQLKGVRFYVSFVTARGSVIRRVANTAGFTIK